MDSSGKPITFQCLLSWSGSESWSRTSPSQSREGFLMTVTVTCLTQPIRAGLLSESWSETHRGRHHVTKVTGDLRSCGIKVGCKVVTDCIKTLVFLKLRSFTEIQRPSRTRKKEVDKNKGCFFLSNYTSSFPKVMSTSLFIYIIMAST